MDAKRLQTINSIITNSEKNAWVIDELLPEDYQFDLTKQFIPMQSGGGVNELSYFNPDEILLISQLHAIEYTRLIHVVEEFIVDIALAQLRPNVPRELNHTRMLSRFIDEELKHQIMFTRFGENIKKRLSDKIIIPDVSSDFSKIVMKKHPLSVWLLTLHAEITTHFHYTDIFKSNQNIEPKFLEILKNHWMEESQHVRVDTFEMNDLLLNMSEAEKKLAMKDYVDLLLALDGAVRDSANVLIENMVICGGTKVRAQNLDVKLNAFLVRTLRNFLVYVAFKHPTVISMIKQIDPSFDSSMVQKLIEEKASA